MQLLFSIHMCLAVQTHATDPGQEAVWGLNLNFLCKQSPAASANISPNTILQ
jgi:hypothetical protein